MYFCLLTRNFRPAGVKGEIVVCLNQMTSHYVCECVRGLIGGPNRGAPAPAGVVPGVADEATAAAARHGRRRDRAAAADHHRTGHRQRHVRHPTQSATQGHLLRTEVTRTTTKPYHTDTIFYF